MHEWISDDATFLQAKIDRQREYESWRRHFWIHLVARLKLIL